MSREFFSPAHSIINITDKLCNFFSNMGGLRRLPGFQLVSDASQRADADSICPGLLQLSSQGSYMNINRSGFPQILTAPYALDNLFPGEDSSLVCHEQIQDLIFLKGQHHGFSPYCNFSLIRANNNIACTYR